MKYATLAAVFLLSAAAFAKDGESKPAMTQAVEAIQPAAEAYSEAVQQKVLEGLAAGEGGTAEAARTLLEQRDRRELEKNRGARKPMKDCIKPNGLIDQDVKDCMDGLISKSW